jgi:hypothetical protein
MTYLAHAISESSAQACLSESSCMLQLKEMNPYIVDLFLKTCTLTIEIANIVTITYFNYS